jgi:hypothetical protein
MIEQSWHCQRNASLRSIPDSNGLTLLLVVEAWLPEVDRAMKGVLAKDRRTNDKATTVLGEEAPGLVLDVFESQLHFDLLSPDSSVRGGHILSLQIHT